jgi:hypothetical protein
MKYKYIYIKKEVSLPHFVHHRNWVTWNYIQAHIHTQFNEDLYRHSNNIRFCIQN